MNSNTDIARENIVIKETEKHKKKIAEFKKILLKEFITIPKEKFTASIEEFINVFEKSNIWALKLKDIAQRNLNVQSQMPDEDMSFLKTAVFLVFYEGIYLSYINIICLLLTRNGHDLYNTFTKKYCATVKDIEAVDTCTKFEFIKIHGFGLVIRNEDRHLRNKIAHLNYTIVDKHRIKIGNNTIDLDKRTFDLFTFVLAICILTGETIKKLKNGK